MRQKQLQPQQGMGQDGEEKLLPQPVLGKAKYQQLISFCLAKTLEAFPKPAPKQTTRQTRANFIPKPKNYCLAKRNTRRASRSSSCSGPGRRRSILHPPAGCAAAADRWSSEQEAEPGSEHDL